MKKIFVSALLVILIMISLTSCNSNSSKRTDDQDTPVRRSSDTAIIPGTPGPSGSEPRPGDTTKAHRDSLKRTSNISDSTKRTKP